MPKVRDRISILRLWPILVVCLGGGCSGGPIINQLDAPGEDRIAGKVVDIALASADADRQEHAVNPFGGTVDRLYYATGPVWRRVFVGGAGSPATLRLGDTKLDESFGAAGFIVRVTYDATAELRVGDRVFTLHSRGSRAAGMMFESARRQAVELAVVDMANQAQQLITGVTANNARAAVPEVTQSIASPVAVMPAVHRSSRNGLGLEVAVADGRIRVKRVMPDSAASGAGLRENDEILSFNDSRPENGGVVLAGAINQPLQDHASLVWRTGEGAPQSKTLEW